MSTDNEQTRAVITAAFHETPRPTGRLVSPVLGVSFEADAVDTALSGLRWPAVPRAVLSETAGGLSSLTPAAFRHYLPAYMIYCVLDPIRADVLVDSIIDLLAPPSESVQAEVVAVLDGEQRAALADALALVAEDVASGAARRRFEARVAGFTAEEREAIRAFGAWVCAMEGEGWEDDPTLSAMTRYWG